MGKRINLESQLHQDRMLHLQGLLRRGVMNQVDMRVEMNLSKTTVSQYITYMLDKGLIKCKQDERLTNFGQPQKLYTWIGSEFPSVYVKRIHADAKPKKKPGIKPDPFALPRDFFGCAA